MPLIRFMVCKRRALLIFTITLLSIIMPFYFYCVKKKLLYIAITTPSNRQPSFYIEYTKSNIYLFCNV